MDLLLFIAPGSLYKVNGYWHLDGLRILEMLVAESRELDLDNGNS